MYACAPGKEFSLLKRKGRSTVVRGQWPPQRPQIIIIGTKALEGFVHHQTSSKPVEHQLRLFFGDIFGDARFPFDLFSSLDCLSLAAVYSERKIRKLRFYFRPLLFFLPHRAASKFHF